MTNLGSARVVQQRRIHRPSLGCRRLFDARQVGGEEVVGVKGRGDAVPAPFAPLQVAVGRRLFCPAGQQGFATVSGRGVVEGGAVECGGPLLSVRAVHMPQVEGNEQTRVVRFST